MQQKKADLIGLKPVEKFETNSMIIVNFINCVIPAAGALCVKLAPVAYASDSGMIYLTIPIVYTVLFSVRGKMSRERFGETMGSVS